MAGLRLGNPSLAGSAVDTSPVRGNDAARIAASLLSVRAEPQISAPSAPRTPKVYMNRGANQYSVGGYTFGGDDYAAIVESEKLLGGEGVAPEGAGWEPADEASYQQLITNIKNPSYGDLFSKGVSRGALGMQRLGGSALQFAGADDLGTAMVGRADEELAKISPYERTFTGPGNFGEAVAATLGEFVPGMAVYGTPGLVVGGVARAAGVASPWAARLGGRLSGMSRAESVRPDIVVRNTALGAATAATAATGVGMGTAETYGEFRDLAAQTGEPIDINARLKSLAAGTVIGGMDLLPVAMGARPLIRAMTAPTGIPKPMAAKDVLKRGAVTGATTSLAEGGTEMAQDATIMATTGQDLTSTEGLNRLANSFLAGATVGGTMGTLGGVGGGLRERAYTNRLIRNQEEAARAAEEASRAAPAAPLMEEEEDTTTASAPAPLLALPPPAAPAPLLALPAPAAPAPVEPVTPVTEATSEAEATSAPVEPVTPVAGVTPAGAKAKKAKAKKAEEVPMKLVRLGVNADKDAAAIYEADPETYDNVAAEAIAFAEDVGSVQSYADWMRANAAKYELSMKDLGKMLTAIYIRAVDDSMSAPEVYAIDKLWKTAEAEATGKPAPARGKPVAAVSPVPEQTKVVDDDAYDDAHLPDVPLTEPSAAPVPVVVDPVVESTPKAKGTKGESLKTKSKKAAAEQAAAAKAAAEQAAAEQAAAEQAAAEQAAAAKAAEQAAAQAEAAKTPEEIFEETRAEMAETIGTEPDINAVLARSVAREMRRFMATNSMEDVNKWEARLAEAYGVPRAAVGSATAAYYNSDAMAGAVKSRYLAQVERNRSLERERQQREKQRKADEMAALRKKGAEALNKSKGAQTRLAPVDDEADTIAKANAIHEKLITKAANKTTKQASGAGALKAKGKNKKPGGFGEQVLKKIVAQQEGSNRSQGNESDARWAEAVANNPQRSAHSPTLAAAVRSGSLGNVLDELRDNDGPVIREIANRIKESGIQFDITMHSDARVAKDMKQDNVAGYYSTKTNTVVISESAVGAADVVAHELVHGFLAATIFLWKRGANIGSVNASAMRRLNKLYNHVVASVPKADREKYYGLSSFDEFVSEGISSQKFQHFLMNTRYEASTLWSSFVSFVADLLGISRSNRNAFAELLSAVDDLTTNLDFLRESRDLALGGGYGNQTFFNIARDPADPNTTKASTKQLPSAIRKPAQMVSDVFGGMASRIVSVIALGNQLFDYAVSVGIPSARRLEEIMASRAALVEHIQISFSQWAEDHARLPAHLRGTGPGTVSGVIEAATRRGAWGFTPEFWRAEDKETAAANFVYSDESHAEYMGLKDEKAKELVRRAFKLNYDLLKSMQDTVAESIEGDFADLLTTASPKEKAELIRSRDASIQRFRRMMSMNVGTPYAPLSRYGSHVVVGMSQEFYDAYHSGDTKTASKLKSNPKHYFLDFAENRAAAAELERSIKDRYAHTDKFTKSADANRYGGNDMATAFRKLDNMLSQMDGNAVKGLRSTLLNAQIIAMGDQSVRKAELRRKGVASADMDMVQNMLTRARAGAHFVGAMAKNREIMAALDAMKDETKHGEGSREVRQNVYNALYTRFADSLNGRQADTAMDSAADKVTSFTATWMLAFSPSYYIQQGLQNGMVTLPSIAARYGYAKSWEAMKGGYKQVGNAWADTALTQQLNVGKVSPKYRNLARFLEESGQLDVGINREMGELSSESGSLASKTFTRVSNHLRALTRKIEAINRLSAGVAVYDLEMDSRTPITQHSKRAYADYLESFKKLHPTEPTPMTEREFAAASAALRVIKDTHGDYSMQNAPPVMRSGPGRIILQFRKFAVMMAGIYVKAVHNALFDPKLSPEEQAVARRVLMFTTGHAAVMGGMMGLPFASVFVLLYNLISGAVDDEERGDVERDIRRAVDNPGIADLLLKGVPTLAGVDMSGNLGLGSLLSIAPYAELPTDRDSYSKYVTSALGPAIGGLGTNFADAFHLITSGEYYGGLEKAMPRGLMQASRAIREQAGGETNARGDLTEADVAALETLWGTLGFSPVDRGGRQYARNQFYRDQEFYNEKTARLKKEYVAASKAQDGRSMARLRTEWQTLQAARVRAGMKPQPVTNLIREPMASRKREANTVAGVAYTTSTKGQAENLARTVL